MDKPFIAEYKKRLELYDAKFDPIAHNDSIVAIVYKIQTSDGKLLILKVCDQVQHFNKELYFLKYFFNKLPVPNILQVVEPEPGLHGAILMEYLPGELLQTQYLTQDLACEVGSLLAKIHLNREVAFGDLTNPAAMVQDPRQYFALKFEESLSECVGHLSPDILFKCSAYFKNNIENLSSVDGPCIIHRDFRPGNIIVHKGKVSGIIDWASARAGFAEDDLCPLEMGEWGCNESIKEAFLDGYAAVRPIPDYSSVMSLLLLNRAIAAVGFTIKIGTWNGRDLELYRRNRTVIEQILQ